MGLLERVNHRAVTRGQQQRQATGPQLSLDDLMAFFNGLGYPFVQTTMSQVDREQIPYSAVGAHNANSAVFSLTLARVQAFSQIRFQWTRFQGTVAQDLFGSPELAVLEKPWPGGRTPHLLSRMEIDNAIAGNAFVVRPRPDRLSRLRPDQVTIILGSATDADFPADAPDVEVAGWYYLPRSGVPKIFLPHQVAHYAPLPDPQFTFLGMSWITAAMREIQGDSLMTEHKVRFLENAATPNLAIKFDPAVGIDAVRQFKEVMEAEHKGAWNAYKTLYLGGGAEPVAVGRDFQQLDFRQVQGKGESRLAAAAGVPPSWVGFSEGLQGSSLNAGNFTAARRRFTDGTMSDLWTHAACALETILTPPDSGAALWYDTRGIPFMHEDGRDQAAIQSEQAQTITKLVREGFTPSSVIKAVTSNDWTVLVHTGLTSVQLQPPSSGLEPMPGEAPALPAANGSSNGSAAAASNGQGGA